MCIVFAFCAPLRSLADVTMVTNDNSETLRLAPELKQAKALNLRAHELEKQGKNSEALSLYDEGVERFATSLGKAQAWQLAHPYATNLLYRAELLTKLEQHEKAMASYRLVIKLFKHFDHLSLSESVTDAELGMAEILASMGKRVEARARFKEVEKRVGASIAVIDVRRLVRAQKYLAEPELDTWSGIYRMHSGSKDNAIPMPTSTVEITKLPDLDEKDVAGRYEPDLARWQMRSAEAGARGSTSVRRFILSDDLNEYEQFGWTQLYMRNKIECMDAGHFFFCKTQPKSTVWFGKDESYMTQSGIFGILRHSGAFELVKVK